MFRVFRGFIPAPPRSPTTEDYSDELRPGARRPNPLTLAVVEGVAEEGAGPEEGESLNSNRRFTQMDGYVHEDRVATK